MRKKLFHYMLSGILFTSLLGTLSHFIYGWSGGNPYAGLFTPVNESVWEHMKLLFFPMLLYFAFEKLMSVPYPISQCCGNAVALLTGTCLIPVLFYTYTGILGYHLAPLDIATFYISVFAAFLLRFRLSVSGRKISKTHCLWLTALTLLIFLCFLIFTSCPPDLGLFHIPA